jgi:hypothetical protein
MKPEGQEPYSSDWPWHGAERLYGGFSAHDDAGALWPRTIEQSVPPKPPGSRDRDVVGRPSGDGLGTAAYARQIEAPFPPGLRVGRYTVTGTRIAAAI